MRVWLATTAALLAGCATTQTGGTVTYELSSPDVGVAWHLHAKDGALICALPCTAPLGASSDAWLGVHDPKRSWRLDVPSDLAAPGSRVFATAHVGKGVPALETVGYVVGVSGTTAAVAGIILLLASFVYVTQGCLAGESPCDNAEHAASFATVGIPAVAGGAILGVVGVTLLGNNRAPTLHVRVTPTGIAGTF